ncbi:hypothetical protein BD779DRAFT_1498682 [Infundibulicybe gibba]|nr:hypothetical protein BD779DRAFT_1498682 [Infundibulicybe gibba]
MRAGLFDIGRHGTKAGKFILISLSLEINSPVLKASKIDRRLPFSPSAVDTHMGAHGPDNDAHELHLRHSSDGPILADALTGDASVHRPGTPRSSPMSAPVPKPPASLPVDPTKSKVQKRSSEGEDSTVTMRLLDGRSTVYEQESDGHGQHEKSKVSKPAVPIKMPVSSREESFGPLEHARATAPGMSQTGPKSAIEDTSMNGSLPNKAGAIGFMGGKSGKRSPSPDHDHDHDHDHDRHHDHNHDHDHHH